MIFQPHLYSRTRDFMEHFAHQLSRVDDLTLLPIYPAREEPLKGISSKVLLDQINLDEKRILSPESAIQFFDDINHGVILTVGAGDINLLVSPLENVLLKNISPS
jgi:UDP-N-acetylmuramate--alanine ligase